MSSPQELLDKVIDHKRKTALLAATEHLLGWDERTKMPAAAGEYRAEQMTLLSGMIHQRNTDDDYGKWLDELADSDLMADPHNDAATIIRESKRSRDKAVKLPQSLVEELTRAAVQGQQAWESARANNDFAAFRGPLEKLLKLKQQQADAIGYAETRYDALLDDFEPHESTTNVDQVLRSLRDELVPLVEAIAGSAKRAPVDILSRSYPVAQQEEFGKSMAAAIGFDFDKGRLDVTAHPFCSGIAPHDCRITTRYDEHFLQAALYGTLHEAGHGIYEQGLRTDQFGLPTGSSVSLGIHESQSRMWENQVGRSRAFWDFAYPHATQLFSSLEGVSADDLYFAFNHVEPSLIRVEADEVTYNLHILIRFEIEQLLLSDELPLDDLPATWNAKYQEYLGITPPDNAEGVLQDVHWSFGAFGYFPTYSLGNLYSAQLFDQANEEIGPLDEQFARGEFEPLREWLREKIHVRGCCYSAAELVEDITGQPLSHAPLVRYLKGKLSPLYDLA